MRVLITGVTGFVGHHMAHLLTQEGHDLWGLVNGDGQGLPASIHAVQGDIARTEDVSAVLARSEPDWIIHLAGAASVGGSFADPLRTWRVNATGTLTLLEAVRRSGRDPRVLVVTSGEIHGRAAGSALPVTEDTPVVPISPYAASKAAADLLAAHYRDTYGMQVLRVRAFNHIGPMQDPRFVVPSVARQIAVAECAGRRELTLTVGNTEVRRDFTDVRDIVRAYALLMREGDPDRVYLACSGASVSIRELIDRLLGMTTLRTEIRTDPARVREGEQPDLYGDPAALRTLGWRPTVPLDTTLADVLDDWRVRALNQKESTCAEP